ncbi:hypothetical protein LAZ67_15001306 [Cordylochernes scorpioides]|uniref:Reverse transcriptase RNase H-like domain-containing protein n=1 Tax=Cordylochernes scorpioides TaxID=51811 RepID=A0ABY6LC64_9ARAC|nr:hypothetical protein LAZ67_15001306 [Cordylochernes scorpioides]
MHPVHYMSKKTNESQQKYSSYELEVLALVEAVKKFRIYSRDPLIKALLVIVKEKQAYDGYFEENNLLRKEVEGNRTLRGSTVPCILSNRKHGKQEGMLHPISKGDTPLDTYHIDHLGPLASTRKDYNYLLVITDGFTKILQRGVYRTLLRHNRSSMRKWSIRTREAIECNHLNFSQSKDEKRRRPTSFGKKKKKAFVYKKGDLVVIQKTRFATKSKLYPKYIGPYKVIKIKPNDRYNVEKFADFEVPNRTSCSADLMKPWFTRDEYPSELSEADEVQDGRM